MSLKGWAAVGTLVVLTACGGGQGTSGGGGASPSGPAAIATPSPSPSPSLLPGSQVPNELSGQWFLYVRADRLLLLGYRYTLDQPDSSAAGNVVVKGAEIDFFNGSQCLMTLPRGVGRYRWKITSDRLKLTPIAPDQCSGREDYLAAAEGWTRTNAP